MKIVIFVLLTFTIIFLTDAVEVTDEDINSPLVSYLLAKLQQLESKIMVRPNSRTNAERLHKGLLNHLLLLITNTVTVHLV